MAEESNDGSFALSDAGALMMGWRQQDGKLDRSASHQKGPIRPPTIRPRPQSQQQQRRESKGISIDNYDPSGSKSFTDPMTLRAMENLGVRSEELLDPSQADINRYTRDKNLPDVVRGQLIERRDRTRALVTEERDRIANLQPTPHIQAKERGEIKSEMSFEALERHRIERLEDKNKKEAREMIISILQEQEMQEEAKLLQQKEIERAKKREEEFRLKHIEERKKAEQQLKRIEEEEARKKQEEEKRRKDADEQERLYIERRQKRENEMKEKFKQLEQDRMEKNKQSKEVAEKKVQERRR
jgi:inner centromere protein